MKFDVFMVIVTASGTAAFVGLIWLILACIRGNLTSATVAAGFIVSMVVIATEFGSEIDKP